MEEYLEFDSVHQCLEHVVFLIRSEGLGSEIVIDFSIVPDEAYWNKTVIESHGLFYELLKTKKISGDELISKFMKLENKPFLVDINNRFREYFECTVYLSRMTFLFSLEAKAIIVRKNCVFDRIFGNGVNSLKYWDYELKNGIWILKKKSG